MNKINKLLSITSAIIWSGIATITTQLPAFANDESALCKNRNLATEVAISTENFYAAICSQAYQPPNTDCDSIVVSFFYVGQSRKTGESITLPANSTSNHSMTIYKASNGKYTYQIATSGGYRGSPRTSLSVFNNGKRTYHRKVNYYNGNMAMDNCFF